MFCCGFLKNGNVLAILMEIKGNFVPLQLAMFAHISIGISCVENTFPGFSVNSLNSLSLVKNTEFGDGIFVGLLGHKP